jgi:hypothetical protein
MASDENVGLKGAVIDAVEFAKTKMQGLPGYAARMAVLVAIDRGNYHPDATTRLGAYAGTTGYKRGTVGASVHHAIGAIYLEFGNWGEERIGTVFNSMEAKRLFNQPVKGNASMMIATIEYGYWNKVAVEDPWSAGARVAGTFSPEARDWLQRHLFNF